MRLWHQDLLPLLPRQQLLGQHREICALRGRGWGRKHATVDYVFRYSPERLYRFHRLVLAEMVRRGYRPDPAWAEPCYRGRNCPPYERMPVGGTFGTGLVYPEHDAAYREKCLENLRKKGVELPV
ncbi:MAG: TIGR02328 family protein [bacterium]